MILQSLVALAQREKLLDEPGYISQAVHWLVDIDSEGRVLGLTYSGTKDEESKREVFRNSLIPKRGVRSAGVKPNLLVDKSDYLFGINSKHKPEEHGQPKTAKDAQRLGTCFEAMLAETQAIAEETGSKLVRAQWRAMSWIFQNPEAFAELWRGNQESQAAHHAENRWVGVPKKWKGNHLFAFQCNGRLVYHDPAVKAWIAAHAEGGKESERDLDFCLVSGNWCRPVKNHDQFDLPGDSGRLPLISFNRSAFEHYGRKSNENAPVGADAANAYFMALRRLLGLGSYKKLPRRKLTLNAKTTVLYWSDARTPEEDGIGDVLLEDTLEMGLETHIQQVSDHYRAPHHHRRPAALENPQSLFTLILTREKSRVVLRGAGRTTIQAVAASLELYFRELEICNVFRDEGKPYRGIRNLLWGLVPSSSKGAEPPGDLANRLYQCALESRKPFPLELLALLLRRIRGRDKEGASRRRLALVKAILNRNFKKELTMSLDEGHQSPSYHLGRLFAVLEKTQQEATNAKAGIADRYLGAAVASPGLVFPRLLKLSHHHLNKIGQGREVNLSRLIDAILSHVPAPLPAVLKLQEQGTFMVGYHHQRAELWRSKTDSSEKENHPRSES